MKRAGGIQVYVMALVLIGLTGMIVMDSWLVRLALAGFTIICGYAAYKLAASRLYEDMASRLAEQEHEHQASVLQMVGRMRHDWMNDIQILSGYIQLKKIDNLQPYMEKIKAEAQQESYLSKLGIPSLISYLLLFRVQTKSMQLEIGLDQEVNLQQLPIREAVIEKLVRDTIEMFKHHASKELAECGVLSLEFDVQEDHLLLDFVFQGAYDRDRLEQAIRQVETRSAGEYSVVEQELQEDEAVLALQLPYRT